MTRRNTPKLITAVPAALMMALHQSLAAAAPLHQQATYQQNHYADGIYTARGTYGGLPSFIVVTVTLRGGIVTAVQVEPQATVPRSLELQRSFAAAVPRVVIGKPIDQIHVGKLAGSSGTPRGFNDAIAKIKQLAAL